MVDEKFVIVAFLFGLVSSVLASTGCPIEFEEMCDCGLVPYGHDRKLTYVTNCTNAGFDNTMMLRQLPQETQVLVFVGNEIKDLPLNIFGLETAYENLHTIDLSNNYIQTIKGRTFHNVANVTELILNDNDLYIVSKDHHPRMFSNFVNLRKLHLRNAFTEKVKAGDYLNNLAEIFENSTLNHLTLLNLEDNEISGMYRGEFCSLSSLEELYLSDNFLTDIPLNFTCLKGLKNLQLANNLISHLSDANLKNLRRSSLNVLNITNNPFKCDCEMIDTYKWMVTTWILVNGDKCFCSDGYRPNIGKNVFAVPLDDYRCTSSSKSYHSSGSFIALTIAFLCLVIFLTVLVYRNKYVVGGYMRRLVQPIRDKFNYVSLERRDVTRDV